MERGASAAPAGKWITGFMENFSCIQSQDEITAIARASGGGGDVVLICKLSFLTNWMIVAQCFQLI